MCLTLWRQSGSPIWATRGLPHCNHFQVPGKALPFKSGQESNPYGSEDLTDRPLFPQPPLSVAFTG